MLLYDEPGGCADQLGYGHGIWVYHKVPAAEVKEPVAT